MPFLLSLRFPLKTIFNKDKINNKIQNFRMEVTVTELKTHIIIKGKENNANKMILKSNYKA